MLKSIPTLGVRFDIAKLEKEHIAFDIYAWKHLWQCVDPTKMPASSLAEGATTATMRGKENVYCLAIQNVAVPVLDLIASRLDTSADFASVAASPKYLRDFAVTGEPLTDAGLIDATGQLVGKSLNSKNGLRLARQHQDASSTPPKESTDTGTRQPPNNAQHTTPSADSRHACETIHDAAKRGDLADVERHVQNGTDVNVRDNDGETPLMWAARWGHLDVVEFLIHKNPYVNTSNKNGWTPLMQAAGMGHLNVVRFLLDKGADINARDNHGKTPLMWASSTSKQDVVEFLVNKIKAHRRLSGMCVLCGKPKPISFLLFLGHRNREKHISCSVFVETEMPKQTELTTAVPINMPAPDSPPTHRGIDRCMVCETGIPDSERKWQKYTGSSAMAIEAAQASRMDRPGKYTVVVLKWIGEAKMPVWLKIGGAILCRYCNTRTTFIDGPTGSPWSSSRVECSDCGSVYDLAFKRITLDQRDAVIVSASVYSHNRGTGINPPQVEVTEVGLGEGS